MRDRATNLPWRIMFMRIYTCVNIVFLIFLMMCVWEMIVDVCVVFAPCAVFFEKIGTLWQYKSRQEWN